MYIKGKNTGFQILAYIVLGILAISCVLPLLILLSGAFTDEVSITANGYSLIPKVFSTAALQYVIAHMSTFSHAAMISLSITFFGTITHVTLAALMAYPLSKLDLPGRSFLSFMVILTILLNGGLVPTYLVYSQILGVKNTYWALLIPGLLLNGYSITLMRNFYTSSIPASMLEAARIDGAGELKIFTTMVVPLSKPMLTTVALMSGMAYWNDWNNGLYYITKPDKMGLQNVLNNIIKNAEFLAQNSNSVTGATNMPVESLRMAVAFVAALPMILVYMVLQKYFVAGMTMGAVKE